MVHAAIEARGLTKRFGDRLAVDELSFDLPEGAVHALLGPNGAGKTTSVRMLAGLVAPTGGWASVAGVEVRQDESALSALHRRIGVLTESPGMWERLSAARNLRIYAELYGVPNPAGAVERYLRMVGLWDRRADPVARLSKGMRQRLAVARALVHEPPVLFLDEPTSGLDPEAAAEVRELVSRLRGEGRAILLCTHNLDEAEKLADRILVFRRRLLAAGTAAELRRATFEPEIAVRFRPPDSLRRHVRCALSVRGVREAREEGRTLLLRVEEPECVLPELARALVADGADVLFLGEEPRSLEETYLAILERHPD
jgi:ABC-2 type transport system ATP-binding protein